MPVDLVAGIVDYRVTRKKVPSIDKATLYRLAAEASCDPRTVLAVFEGRKVRSIAGDRAHDVLVKNGFMPSLEIK